jgi:hypothetical protein
MAIVRVTAAGHAAGLTVPVVSLIKVAIRALPRDAARGVAAQV